MIDTAITVFVDNNEKSIIEFDWLARSWKYSRSCEMSDLIVFYNSEVSVGRLPRHKNIIYIPIKPISETEKLWADYRRINATWYLTTPEAAFISKYRYILKTDNDVFLTKNFATFRPRLATFGMSSYASNPAVANNLTRISEEWGIKQHLINVGCTIMAPGEHVLVYVKNQYEYCKRLKVTEFPDGKGEWPGWTSLVLNMYAGCLAANATFGNSMVLGGLDVLCMCKDQIGPTDYHIHAWHTNNFFSKHHWYKGEYDSIKSHDLNPEIISEYCLWIAGRRVA